MFEIELKGIEGFIDLRKNVRTGFKEMNGRMVRDFRIYFREELSKIEQLTTHSIVVGSLNIKNTPTGISVSVKYVETTAEDNLEEQKAEYEKLLSQKKDLQEKRKDISNKIANRRRNNSKNRKQLEKLESRHDALPKGLGRTSSLARNYKNRIKNYSSKIASDSFNIETLSERYVSLQEGIQIMEKAIVDSKPVLARAASGEHIVRPLTFDNVMKSKDIPDSVRSQYITKHITEQFIRDKYADAFFDVVIEAIGAK